MTGSQIAKGESLIKLTGIKKVFYTDEVETHALEDVHLDIKKGEYIAISGPSGCGKTTLLSLLGLLDTPTGGEYLLEGQPVANLDAAERARVRNRQIGFIFQAFNLIGDLTVYENVELPLTYRGLSSNDRKERVQAALEKVGMSHRVKHYPAQLSRGIYRSCACLEARNDAAPSSSATSYSSTTAPTMARESSFSAREPGSATPRTDTAEPSTEN